MKAKTLVLTFLSTLIIVSMIVACTPAAPVEEPAAEAPAVEEPAVEEPAAEEPYEIAVVVKILGIPWFNTLELGVDEAAEDLGVNAYMTGPTQADPAQQVKIVEDLVSKGVDAIAVVPNDAESLVPVFKKAKEKGILILTHESPGQEGAEYDLESIDNEKYAIGMFKPMVDTMGDSGEYAIFIGSLTVPLDNYLTDLGEAWVEENYPDIKLVTERIPCAEDQELSREKALELIKAYPNLSGIVGVGSLGPIGAGQAVREKGLQDKVTVAGAMLPSQASPYFEDGAIDGGVTWRPNASGYDLVWLAKYILDGNTPENGAKVGDREMVIIDNNTIIIDAMDYITKENVDTFGF